jgi:hypothetical protein
MTWSSASQIPYIPVPASSHSFAFRTSRNSVIRKRSHSTCDTTTIVMGSGAQGAFHPQCSVSFETALRRVWKHCARQCTRSRDAAHPAEDPSTVPRPGLLSTPIKIVSPYLEWPPMSPFTDLACPCEVMYMRWIPSLLCIERWELLRLYFIHPRHFKFWKKINFKKLTEILIIYHWTFQRPWMYQTSVSEKYFTVH